MAPASNIGNPPGPERAAHGVRSPYDAVLFDMDGVLTKTAAVHAAAWKRLFDAVLRDPRGNADGALADFDEDEDYRRYVDGRTREDGVTGYLSSRGIELPLGAPDDPPDAWTTYGLAARKDKLFLTSISRDGVTAYPGTIALLDRLRAGRVAVGLVTASRNADQLLASAELDSRFDVIVDGQVAAEMNLPGKPDPAMFLACD